MSIKYQNDMTPFDMTEKPSKQYFFLMPLIWLAAYIDTRKFSLRIDKSGIKGLKPPYLVIATHQGPADYSAAPLALFPHRGIYVSDMEGFAYYGKWLYRGLGCIGKRRFVSDITVVKNMKRALMMKQPVVVYPESRHSNVGTTAYIPKNLGKLCKFMDVPVVIFTLYGSYLANPFWDELNTRKLPLEGRIYKLYDREKVRSLSAEEIQSSVEDALRYDEYKYQLDKKIMITEPDRAKGLHKALYICRKCGARYRMQSAGDILSCTSCDSRFRLREDGYLEDVTTRLPENAAEDDMHAGVKGEDTGGKLYVIPDWYEWERELEIERAKSQIESGSFVREYHVRVEALPGQQGFVRLGKGMLALDENEFTVSFGKEVLHFPHRIRESVQTEYDYRGIRGQCIVLSTKDCCYYLYSDDEDFNPTELQFLGEWLFVRACDKRG